MRMSRLFARTLREAPSGAEIPSHQLLVRAGYIRQVGAGIFALLPLGQRVSDRIEGILREEMNAVGGQEMTMPVVNPATIWKQTGRWFQIGAEMARFRDRGGRDMVLAMTHEEVVAELTRDIIQSYRQLPQLIYHIQTKWRDDPRPRGGLIRVREFVMKDSYSLDADEQGLDRQYRDQYQAYFNIFRRCGIPVVAVLADVGMMGGSDSHEFMYLTPSGEDTILICGSCGHMANRQIATFRKPMPEREEPRELDRVDTPGVTTIEALSDFLRVPESRIAKAVFQVATLVEDTEEREVTIMAVVRGDMELSETKLRNAVRASDLRPATDEEIRGVGSVPGYASPVTLTGEARDDLIVAVDDLIPGSPNLIAGGNEVGVHLRNVNYGRDFDAEVVTDLAAARDGCACPECGEELHTRRGVEVGNIFKLGTRYSKALNCTFLNEDGVEKPVQMGSYGIGSGRLLACIAEENRDEHGLIWPVTVAPYEVHIVELGGGEEEAARAHASLEQAGLSVLYDDRDETAGVKFNDADLLGMPIRLTVSGRSLRHGGLEMKVRRQAEPRIVSKGDLVEEVQKVVRELRAEIDATLTEEHPE